MTQLDLAYTHIVNGSVVQGELIRRPCQSRIDIYAPVDHSDRRAIIIVQSPHNHPLPPATKLGFKGEAMYKEAVIKYGITGATAQKIDRGMP